MKLLELRKNVFYISGILNIGVIANERDEVLLIDAGLDERIARRVKAVLDENKFKIKGIIITHAHADHYGGACCLSQLSGARIYSSEMEKGVINTPILEALSLFGGAYPPAELRRKFFNAPKVAVYGTVSPGRAEIEGFPLEIVDLSGHTLGQVGVAVEKVLFCADSIATSGQIQKQGILKHANIEQALQTCERLKFRKELIFVPSHGPVLDNISPLIAETQASINHIITLVLNMTDEPATVEDLLAQICAKKAVTIKSLSQYYVFHLSILAYLGYLLDQARIAVIYRDSKQFFQRTLPGITQ
jgi:glyoxylase-like metal-dependent hydrolase (beta-lactamase superfamily II)